MAIKSITVTELKQACLDPQWRRDWIDGKNPPTPLLFPTGSIAVYGTSFHCIVKNFVEWLSIPENRNIAFDLRSGYTIWDKMYSMFAEKEITTILKSNKLESALYLTSSLKAFCHKTAKLRNKTANFNSWDDIFLTNEYHIKDIQYRNNNNSLFVSGQLDAVRMHPGRGIEIVDYKLIKDKNSSRDLLQLAIYAALLKRVKPQLKFNGILEYFVPELREVAMTIKQLNRIFNDTVMPVISELIDVNTTVTGTVSGVKPESSLDEFPEKAEQTYPFLTTSIETTNKQKAPQLISNKTRTEFGAKIISMENKGVDLPIALSIKSPPIISPSDGIASTDIQKEVPDPDIVQWKNVAREIPNDKPLSFPIGMDVDNKVIWGDFANPNMCHALVVGAADSCKSEFLKSLTASLIKNNTPGTLKLTIIDPKVLTFSSFFHLPFFAGPVITDNLNALICLENAVNAMDKRYKQIATEGYNDLSARIRDGKKDIPFHVIIFDEFVDVMQHGSKEKVQFETIVGKLGAKGMAAGIHMVLSTQHSDKNITTNVIKSNLPLKICMKVTSPANSSTALDNTGAKLLTGCGELQCNRGHGIERAQLPFVSSNDLNAIGRSTTS